jgi:hypothetical protein
MFPGISTPTNPLALTGAARAVPNSGPPRDEIDRRRKRPAAVKRHSRILRVYVFGAGKPTGRRYAIHGTVLMTVAAPPAPPRPGVPVHRPALEESRLHAMLKAPVTPSGTEADVTRVGAGVHRRPLPGHLRHHHPSRRARHPDRRAHQGTSKSQAATADAPRGRSLPDVRSPRRQAATSGADQGPAGHRAWERQRASERPRRPVAASCRASAHGSAHPETHASRRRAPRVSPVGRAGACRAMPVAWPDRHPARLRLRWREDGEPAGLIALLLRLWNAVGGRAGHRDYLALGSDASS